MREDDHKIRVIDAEVVAKQRLCVQISRSGENRSSGVDHNWQPIRLRTLVDDGEAAISIQVGVGREHLMRRVHLDGANAEFGKAVHFRAGIGHGSRKNASERNEPVRRHAAVLCAPVIHFGCEADNLRRDVVDQSRAFDSQSVEKCQERF